MNDYCGACTETGRRGYCAPLRCYCGHADCYAYTSYTELPEPNFTAVTKPRAAGNAWAQREGATWIDNL